MIIYRVAWRQFPRRRSVHAVAPAARHLLVFGRPCCRSPMRYLRSATLTPGGWRLSVTCRPIVGRVNSAFPIDFVDLQVDEHGPDARVVTVTGEVDALTAPELAACLAAQLAVAQVVVVNLDGVRFLASAGLAALFESNERATQQDLDLRLVCNSWTANLVLEATGLREYFTFADTVPDALTNLF